MTPPPRTAACIRNESRLLCLTHERALFPSLAHRCNGWIDAIEAEAAEDAVGHHILSEAAERYKDMDWRKEFEPLAAQAAAPDALRAALPPTPTICKCGAAKSYHRPQDKRDHDYEPRYPADAVRLGWDAALAAPAVPAAIDPERLARALAKYRRGGQFTCTVLHSDQFGNPMPCPDGPRNEAAAIAAAYTADERL